MKSIVSLIVLFLVIAPGFLTPVSALSRESIAPLPIGSGGQFFDDVKQFYDVSLDGEGEALVAVKFSLAFLSPLEKFSFEIPGRDVRILGIVQEYVEASKTCGRYGGGSSCDYYYDSYSPPKYYSAEFSTDVLSESSLITVTLPKSFPLPSNASSASLLVMYKVGDVAMKSGGVFSYDFSTVKVKKDVSQVRVSVKVVPPFILKGSSSGAINYRESSFGVSALSAEKFDGSQSEPLQQFSRNIEYAYGDVKTAYALDPLESFSVTGDYAESRWLFYKWWIALGVLFSIAVLVGGVFAVKKLLSDTNPKSGMSTTALVLLSSALSAIVVTVTLVGVYVLSMNMRYWVGYQFEGIIIMFLLLVTVLVVLAALIVPPLFVGLNRGAIPAIITVVVSLALLFAVFVVLLIIGAILNAGFGPVYYF